MAIFNSYVKLPEGTTGYSTALFIDSTYSQFQIIKHVLYAHVLSPSGYGSKIHCPGKQKNGRVYKDNSHVQPNEPRSYNIQTR